MRSVNITVIVLFSPGSRRCRDLRNVQANVRCFVIVNSRKQIGQTSEWWEEERLSDAKRKFDKFDRIESLSSCSRLIKRHQE